MATKLKNLKIKKVDFVDQGANPDAHIRMVKRKNGEEQSAGEDSDRDTGGILKKFFAAIGKAAGMNQEEINSAMDEIQKGDSVSFGEKFKETKNRKIVDEIWDICYALQSSLCSILNDEELDSTGVATAMKGSLDEFNAVMQESIEEWSNGKEASIVMKMEEVSEPELQIMKSAVERLNEVIEKAEKVPDADGPKEDQNQEGEEKEMKIDKSKLTEAERAFLDSIEKRCGTEESGDAPTQNGTQDPAQNPPAQVDSSWDSVSKSTTGTVETPQPNADNADNIYKGLNPAVAAEIASLRKFREEAEERELTEVAKKYAIIGKKAEELVPLFKSLRAAGGTAYNDMIAVLDQTVEAVEKSGVFSEIGKSGNGSDGNSAEAKVSGIAKKLMEENPTLSYTQAMAKAWEDNPELLAEYDDQEGF